MKTLIAPASAKPCVLTGSSVSVLVNEKKLEITIKSPQEIEPASGVISYESPLARAIMQKCEGDEFCYKVETRKFTGKILKIHGN